MTDPDLNFTEPVPDELEEEFDLACSSCNADLTDDDLFLTLRVCRECRRHFWLPARERIGLLADDGSFQETSAELVSIDPLLFHDRLPVADRLAGEREQPTVAEAVITGTARIGGVGAVLIALDLAVFSSGIGIVAGEKIALALERAITRRLPVIALCSGGSGKGQEGVLAFAQAAKLAAVTSRMHRVGVPLIAVLTHPTTGNVLVGLANQADVAFAEPGAQVALTTPASTDQPAGTAESLVERGVIDGIVDRSDLRDRLASILALLSDRGSHHAVNETASPQSIPAPARAELPVALRPGRPTAREYICSLSPDAIALRGNRSGSDDPRITGGIGRVGGISAVVIGVQRTESALGADAFSKLIRLIRLAAHLELPVISLVETGGMQSTEDDPVLALRLAQTLSLIAAMPVPVISVAIGTISGLPGVVLLTADRVLMQEHAVVAQKSGEAVASSRDCLRLGLVDTIVPEPLPADEDPAAATEQIELAVRRALAELSGFTARRLIDDRGRRLRHIGLSTDEGREAARIEWRELQDLQRMIGRSIGDIRERWTHRPVRSGRPSLPHFQVRPGMPSITVPKLNFRKPDLTELSNRMAATRRGFVSKRQQDSDPEGEDSGE